MKPRMTRLEVDLGDRTKVIELNGDLAHRVSFNFDADVDLGDTTVLLRRGDKISFHASIDDV